ncbi:MAG: serine hydrolase [Chitinophagaceae bacterium]|nr:serine hydrolase [Chitinophagaceae bacterium]
MARSTLTGLLLFLSIGIAAQPIAKLQRFVDSIFKPVANIISPGCAVTIIQNNKVVVKKAYGMASLEHKVAFTHNTVVRLPYSEAREFISLAALLMENDGILKLEDKVHKYFPLLPEWAAPVTIWDLLNHRSGFADEWATLLLSQNSMSNRFEKDQFLRLLYHQPEPEVEPGKGYLYSNSDFGLLRLIMEAACGNNLPDWMRKRMFNPLKMAATGMQKDPLELIPGRADMYAAGSTGRYMHGRVQKTSPGGNYFILTTADDIQRWFTVLSDSTSELGKASNRLLQNVRMIPGKESHLVTGYSVPVYNSRIVIMHEGVNGYLYLSRVPSERMAVITIGNRDGDGFGGENKAIIRYLLKVKAPVLPKLITVPIRLPVVELQKYEGNYRWANDVSWENGGQTRKFSSFFIEGNTLKVRYMGNYVIELTPVAKDIFYYNEGFGVQFEFTHSPGTPMKVTVTFDDGFPGAEVEKDGSTWKPSKDELAGFKGKYHSRHLDYYWYIVQDENGGLLLRRSNLPDVPITPDGINQFHYTGEKYPDAGFDSWILFNRNNSGEITGLTVWSGRVMHHRFARVN